MRDSKCSIVRRPWFRQLHWMHEVSGFAECALPVVAEQLTVTWRLSCLVQRSKTRSETQSQKNVPATKSVLSVWP